MLYYPFLGRKSVECEYAIKKAEQRVLSLKRLHFPLHGNITYAVIILLSLFLLYPPNKKTAVSGQKKYLVHVLFRARECIFANIPCKMLEMNDTRRYEKYENRKKQGNNVFLVC